MKIFHLSVKFYFVLIVIGILSLNASRIHRALIQSLKNQTENYEELWKKAENLIKEDKPESARSVVQKIYNKAKSEKNVSHWFKSLCYLYYLSSLKDEFPEELNHAHLQKEVKSAPFPLNALLYS